MDLLVLLRINALLFLIFGAGFLWDPARLAEFGTGAAPTFPSALIDMRATYGGVTFGFGAFLAWCLFTRRALQEAGVASVLVLFGLALGRVIGIAVDGSPNAMTFVMLIAELLFGVLLVTALRGSGSRSYAASPLP